MRPRISAAEWEVMNVVWARQPLTATQVFDALPPQHGWKQKTVNTFLTRLAAKGVLAAAKEGKAFVYSARNTRDECVRNEGESFLHRVFQGAAGDLMLHFCERADLSPDEIRELEQLLKAKKGKR
jgi:BlaI family transcriptional regulator, penicillinase repressor